MTARPTNNPAAHDAYLRARALTGGAGWHFYGDLPGAIRLYQEAVRLDPDFVLAWAYLSIAQSLSYYMGFDPSAARSAEQERSIARSRSTRICRRFTLLAAITSRTKPARWRNTGKPKGIFRIALTSSMRSPWPYKSLDIGRRRSQSFAARLGLIPATLGPPEPSRAYLYGHAPFS